MARYQVREGSQSAHCCFDATVVDTARPIVIGGKPYGRDGASQFEEVCECFSVEDAATIADALNAQAKEEK